MYSDDGFHAINPQTGLPDGIFEVGGGWPMVPDSSKNTVFILSKYVWQENRNFTLDLFDINHYTPITRVPFTTAETGFNPLGSFIRCGSNGLALNFKGGNIYLLPGSIADDNTTASKTAPLD